MAAIIDLEGIGLTFPGAAAPVFTGIDLSVRRGEFVAVVGASGAGKSSLLRIVAGLITPSAGNLRRHMDPDAGRLATAMVFQEARLMPWRTVNRNVALGLEGLALDREQMEPRVAEALSLVGLGTYGKRWAHELSGGQRQRVGIARALAVDPELLLMDEPFGALDAITRQTLQDELLRIWRETRKSILFVTHDIDEAVYLGDRVVLLGGTPARIVQVYDIDTPRPRQRETGQSSQLAARVKSDLHNLFDAGGGI